VPLTRFQREVLAALASVRTDERYLAGGAALHFAPDSLRYSHDLDFFHDSAERVAETFTRDREALEAEGFSLEVRLSQPGFIRCLVMRDGDATQIDWAHDSCWRFLPLVRDDLGGLLLHEIDLAVNKTLTLAGRDEIRDVVDILYAHERILSLGALTWAAVGKDPGFTPLSLLEQLKRTGRYQPEDIERLDLAAPFDPVEGKRRWLAALEQAEEFVGSRPPDEVGCLYYSRDRDAFVTPSPDTDLESQGVVPHFGRPGGVVPRPTDWSLFDEDGRGS